MKKILIIGAISSIAVCAARIWASQGNSFFLVARNIDLLDALAYDLIDRGACGVNVCAVDLIQFEKHVDIVNEAYLFFEKIDIVLIAHGTLSNQKECEISHTLALKEINLNALTVVSLLTILANRFEVQKSGTLAVISSVAGERGRQMNYVYGSAKALVTAFTSGLRQRLYKSNVHVVTIKPGFVDTTMTKNFNKGILWTKPDFVALKIVEACRLKGGVRYIPSFWWAIMFIIKLIPEKLFMKLRL